MTFAAFGDERRTDSSDLRRFARLTWKPLALAAFAGWVITVGAHHEAWADESQAWLVARDSSLSDLLFHRVRYEGTPGLWHALLWVSIRAGLPFAKLYLLSGACAIGAAALILWRSPFPTLLRLALIASYFVAYQYAVVARSYALDLLLLPALAALFDRRAERPLAYAALIGLLANCNAHSFIAAAILGCEFAVTLYRGRPARSVLALALALAGGLFALACAWQPAEAGFLDLKDRTEPWSSSIRFVVEAFIDRVTPWTTVAVKPVDLFLGLPVSIAVLAPSFVLFRRAKRLSLAVALCGALLAFAALVYSFAWHAGVLFLIWVLLLWISWGAADGTPRLRRFVAGSVLLVCGAQAVEAAHSGVWDFEHPYSAAPQAAPAIADWRATHPGGTIGALGFKTFALQPHFARNIFTNYKAGAPTPAYIVWKPAEAWHPFPEAADWDGLVRGGYDLLVVSTTGFLAPVVAERQAMLERAGYRLTASFPGHMMWKGYERNEDVLLLFARSDVRPGLDAQPGPSASSQ